MDTPEYKKRGLSDSSGGRGIAVSTTATLIHTALSSPAANEWDEVRLWAVNGSTGSVTLTLYWGAETVEDALLFTLPAQSGLLEIVPGLLLQGGLQLKGAASASEAVRVYGWVNRYEQRSGT